jgi:hypothetical protein
MKQVKKFPNDSKFRFSVITMNVWVYNYISNGRSRMGMEYGNIEPFSQMGMHPGQGKKK